jgi:hypothetical protein
MSARHLDSTHAQQPSPQAEPRSWRSLLQPRDQRRHGGRREEFKEARACRGPVILELRWTRLDRRDRRPVAAQPRVQRDLLVVTVVGRDEPQRGEGQA